MLRTKSSQFMLVGDDKKACSSLLVGLLLGCAGDGGDSRPRPDVDDDDEEADDEEPDENEEILLKGESVESSSSSPRL